MYGLDKTKELADKIQEISEGCKVDNQLGTNTVPEPVEVGLEEYNKGAEFGIPHQSHFVMEGVFFGKKKPKTGTYRQNLNEDEPPAFIRDEVQAERQKQAEAGSLEDAKLAAFTKYAKSLGMDTIEYGRLLKIKQHRPEELEKYKEENKIKHIGNEEILSVEEILRKIK